MAGETVLARRSLPQPCPTVNSAGDCGACALGGALGLSVEEVYSRFDSQGITNRHEMARALRCAASYSLADRILETPAEWRTHGGNWEAFGSLAYLNYLSWFNYIRMAIDAGYYGLGAIDFGENGGPDTNHWVLICGARTDGPVLNKTLTGEVLLSCSVKGERWHEARDLLMKLGAYDALIVRPKCS